MNHVRKSIWVACCAAMACMIGVWALHAGPLDPSAPPASTMKSLQEVYDLTNSTKGAALPAPLIDESTKMFLQVEGIPGESMDANHKGWIEPAAFHWGVSRPGQTFTPAGTPLPVADFGDLTVVKQVDKATPKLFLKCCNGGMIRTLKLEIWPIGTAYKYPLIEYKLGYVIVTQSKPVGANVGASPYLMEEVSFNYSTIEITYNEQDPKSGELKGTVTAGWDRVSNQGI
jgi:type VI secretion system Hcp family effector